MHYPVDVLGGAGIGMAAGGVILLALVALLRRARPVANGANSAADPGSGPSPEHRGEP